MTQNDRLNILVDRFIADSSRNQNLAVGDSPEEKRIALRSLMNIRSPRPMDGETLRIQDEYLRERMAELGVVGLRDIPTIRERYGSAQPFADILSLWQGDITRLAADAIVNAANSAMLGCFRPMHACIDNCIHTYAGIQLRAECARQMEALRQKYGDGYEQPTAVPMLTDAYNLPARKIIHIVGPIVRNRLTPGLEKELADCYRNTLDLCLANGLQTVAFCGISTGVFRFPPERAAEIAVGTVAEWLRAHDGSMTRVIFNVHSDASRRIYESLLQ